MDDLKLRNLELQMTQNNEFLMSQIKEYDRKSKDRFERILEYLKLLEKKIDEFDYKVNVEMQLEKIRLEQKIDVPGKHNFYGC